MEQKKNLYYALQSCILENATLAMCINRNANYKENCRKASDCFIVDAYARATELRQYLREIINVQSEPENYAEAY